MAHTPAGTPQIVPDRDVPTAWLVRTGGIDQSWVDPRDPTRLEFDYTARIGAHIDAQAPPGSRLRVVHIGGAGMSLARYVAATRPHSPQIVIEPDAALTQAVRDTIGLPREFGIKVRAMDGRTALRQLRADYADLVILDAFAGGQVPADLVTVECFQAVSRVLGASGTIVANLVDARPFEWTRRVVAGLSHVFAHTALSAETPVFKGRRFGNLIAAASGAELPVDALNRSASSSPFPYRLVGGPELTSFVAGARPFTDADTAPSPPRTDWRTWRG
ncbi:MAG: fused MFS/spermidine synthase [Actinomycetia bacterium]|nr:fused MFS/spermidine synthase [Actinomycetes bacterium]